VVYVIGDEGGVIWWHKFRWGGAKEYGKVGLSTLGGCVAGEMGGAERNQGLLNSGIHNMILLTVCSVFLGQ